jgi:small nuclear ribonucleoprotein (snRNP)-like protein
MPEASLRLNLAELVGKTVVVDTNTRMVYLGTLRDADEFFLTLEDADVHDLKDGSSSKDAYIHDARRSGIKKNRHRVFVRLDSVVSFSLLEDVVVY